GAAWRTRAATRPVPSAPSPAASAEHDRRSLAAGGVRIAEGHAAARSSRIWEQAADAAPRPQDAVTASRSGWCERGRRTPR
ncbi:hypothetical protein RZS08_04995, partial [Arthrospira platensis SPKY1]|nr:hypothetical protein [Arthrospira platensis SPKY1]